MEFSDFKDNPNGLIGQYVLWTSGSIHSPDRSISRINKVTKTSFKIEGNENSFNISNGYKKGGDTGRSSWGFTNRCELISEEKANQLLITWRENKAKRVLMNEIMDFFKSPENREKLTIEQLGGIGKILFNR